MKRIFALILLLPGLSETLADDYSEHSIEKLHPLAERGNAEAQFFLGVLLNNGYGVPVNYREAAIWYRRAAEQGHAKAQYSLGLLYAKGEGVKRDSGAAIGWYCKAARQDNALAMNKLGLLYVTGEGVNRDRIRAYMWFTLAIERGVDRYAGHGRLNAQKMTDSQITNAQRMTKGWTLKRSCP